MIERQIFLVIFFLIETVHASRATSRNDCLPLVPPASYRLDDSDHP